MTISTKDRKTLWGRSGSRCAICRKHLVAQKSESDPEAIVGDEAHIAAQSPGGPRWDQLPPTVGVDSYDNLILLCRVHHKVIDDQPNHYTGQRLRELKAKHEKWVNDRLDDPVLLGLYDHMTEPVKMTALTTGTAVWDLVENCQAFLLSPPSDGEVELEAVDLADEFLELCRDYGDISEDVKLQGMGRVREVKRTFQDYLSRLAGYGLLAFGTQQLRSVPGFNPPLGFRVAIISVLRADSPTIIVASE